MSIETDIRQQAFRNPYHKIQVNLMYTANWHHFEHLRLLKPFGLTLHEYNVLRILRGNSPKTLTLNQIIERILDKMSNASRVVDGLVSDGLVERNSSEYDRRMVDVKISEKGLSLISELDDLINDSEKRFHTLTEDEAEQLSVLLDKLRG